MGTHDASDRSPLSDDRSDPARRAAEVMLAEELAGYAQTHPDVKVFRHCVPADTPDVLQWASAHADLLVLSAPRPYDGMVAEPSRDADS
jgi:hypothetical protein